MFTPNLTDRIMEPEMMDEPALGETAHQQALSELEKIFWLSRTAQPIWQMLCRYHARHPEKSLRGLDLGCGGGDLPIALTRQSQAKRLPIVCDGSDMNPRALAYAENKVERNNLDIQFLRFQVPQDPIPHKYDFAVSSLFLHHLNESELVDLFRSLHETKLRLVIFSDLIRSSLGWILCRLTSQFLSNSPVVKQDALLSLRAAYTLDEINHLAHQSGLENFTLRKVWPERFLFVWQR